MRKVLLISIFTALPSAVFGANDMYTVHAWGYGDLLYNVLMSIKTLVGSGSYQRMLSIALLIGALVAVLSLMNAKDFSVYMVAQKIIAGILLYTFIVFSPHDIFIKDHTTGKNYEVRDVPSMVGFPLMLFSNLERGASEIFRTSLASSPGGLANIGAVPVITGYDLLYTTSNYRIQDPNFNRTMSEFVQNCVYPDVLSGYLDIGALVNSNTFWQLLNNTHPARVSGVFGAGSSGIDGNLIPCPQVYTDINTTLDKYVGAQGTAKKQLASAMGFLADDQIDTILGAVSKQTFNYQQSGQNFLRNAIALNNFNDAYALTAKQVGMDTSGIAYGVAKGTETSATQMTLSGIMAKKYMPISKGFMTVIMIAIIPLIMLIGLATNSIRKPVGMIVGILTALSLWAIGSQLLDFFIMIRTKSLMSGVENGVYSMATKPIVEQGILDSINMAMSMYWMIPTLSFAVASMSGYSASQMMSGVGATANSAIGGAAGEVASGSASYGVTRTNMMSANKYDGVSSLRGGTVSQGSLISNYGASNDRATSADDSISQVDSDKRKTDIDHQNTAKYGDVEEHKNNKTYESILKRESSNINLTQDIDKTNVDHRDSYQYGLDILTGKRSANDNSNKNLSGTSYETNNTVSIAEGTKHQGAMQGVLDGNSDAVSRLANMQVQYDEGMISSEQFESEKRAFASAMSKDVSGFRTDHESNTWGTNLNAKLEAYAQAGGKIPFTDIGGGIKGSGSFGIGRTDDTSKQQNLIAREYYEAVGNANTEAEKYMNSLGIQYDANNVEHARFKEQLLSNVMGRNMQYITNEKLNENLDFTIDRDAKTMVTDEMDKLKK